MGPSKALRALSGPTTLTLCTNMKEEEVINLTISSEKKERYLHLLANPNKRKKILDDLNHKPSLNLKYTTWHTSFDEALKSVKVNPKHEVYVISSAPQLDGKTMAYENAISEIRHFGWGTIVGVTIDLAIYYGEGGERAAVINRSA